jgi:hypothetical protein
MEHLESVKFAAETVKQVLTLSSAILVLTVTFAKDHLLKEGKRVTWTLKASWVCFLVSALAGVWTLLTLTAEAGNPKPSIWKLNVALPTYVLNGALFLGLLFTVWAGWHALGSARGDSRFSSSAAGPTLPPNKSVEPDAT